MYVVTGTHFGLLRLNCTCYWFIRIRGPPGPHASEGLKIKRKRDGEKLTGNKFKRDLGTLGRISEKRKKKKIVCVCHTSSTCNKHRGFSWVRLSSRNPYYYYQMLDDSLREQP